MAIGALGAFQRAIVTANCAQFSVEILTQRCAQSRCILENSTSVTNVNMTADKHTAVDWHAVWSSFAWDDAADDAARSRERLRLRARQYAAPKAQTEAASAETALTALVFELGDERYGVDVTTVRRVRPLGHITRVPGIPPFYRGVVNVRGQVVTVLDLRLFFDIPVADGTNPPQELVVVQAGRLEIGLIAHNVQGVIAIPRAEIKAVEHIRYALGITAQQLVLLDVRRLFEDERLIVGSKDEA